MKQIFLMLVITFSQIAFSKADEIKFTCDCDFGYQIESKLVEKALKDTTVTYEGKTLIKQVQPSTTTTRPDSTNVYKFKTRDANAFISIILPQTADWSQTVSGEILITNAGMGMNFEIACKAVK